MTTPTLEKNELSTNYLEIFKSDNSKLVQLTEHMIQTNEVKTPLEFAKKFMFTFDSKEPFPINIEVLIEMKVYDLVGNIKKKLNKNFILDTDFKVQNLTCEFSQVKKTHGGARHKENIMLTVDCFKSMCMLANSETGKQVKMYYLDLEKIFKQYIITEFEEQKQEKEKLSQEHSKLVLNHEKLLKRRNRTDYETGNVVYIISHEAFSIAYKCNYFKFGKSTQKGDETRACFKQRLSTYNTGAPVNYNVHYLLYVDNNALIEEIIKEKFSNQLDPSNKEWIKGLSLETVIMFIKSLMELMNVSYKEVMLDPIVYVSTDKKSIELVESVESETESLDKPDFSKILEEIDKYTDKKLRVLLKEYNLTQSGLKDDKKNRLKNHILKGCTSVCEKCDENKELTELNFRKTQIGFVKVCLECEKKECEKTLLYRKHVHTEITQGVKTKVCPGCKTEKIYDDFHKNKGNKDGLVSRCKNCESSRKSVVVNVALKKVAPKVELGKKWCPKCEKIKENCNFRNAVSRPDGLQHSCKECENETRRRNRKINKL